MKDGAGGILARGKAQTDPQALFEVLKEHGLCPVVLETGMLSGWLARGLHDMGVAVDVIDARQAHAVMCLQHKQDRCQGRRASGGDRAHRLLVVLYR